jgi:tripartite-type tricarboxylate transporter receptor subunit TctC
VAYDPVRDFAPVALVARAPYVLVVHPSVTANSVKELIAFAKANPGKLNYSMTSVGGGAHLASELFKAMAGLNIVRISYKTSAQEASDLIAGHVQLAFSDAGTVSPHIKANRLKALGVASAQPSPLVPGVPTVASSLPGFEANQLIGLFAPAGTPDPIVRRLNQEFVRVVNLPEARERLFSGGVDAVGSSPEEFGAIVKSDMAKMGKVIKDADIRVE